MNKIFKFTLFFYCLTSFLNISLSNENYFEKGLELYKNKKYSRIKESIENLWEAPLCKRAERKAILKSSLLTDI